MTLKTIFSKPVDRPIEGVIKADDDASLRLEIEEYVLTDEVSKRLECFLDAYNNYDGANGVWISGFFGSGKSHLLKILSMVLENKEIDGAKALDLFSPKCADNVILRGDLNRAVSIPSKSILFNIDQKADVISKNQVDALLAVFVKVFDEMCGYYGKQGHIAQFERDLDSRGLYEQFQTVYQETAGIPWQKGREQALLETKNIAKAYTLTAGGDDVSGIGVLDKYRSQYKVSIEDFAEQINAYIERQTPGFRLNFFVDEVGQYIAENVKLMTNLQTIAESLATKSRGRAWVIVTSQNDMSTVLGEMSKQQSNDFSKIMARFATKILLTSTNVAEVIQKRLLAKTEDGTEKVSDIYHLQVNNFGTLFGFTDGSREYKPYRDRDDFILSYPFVPYQFDLFQSAIENLSRHNAFEGKHSSVGERSMLGVFQQVAIKIGDLELGQLATFDLMFEGIQNSLKAQTQKAIKSSERQLSDPFAIRLLKMLFLVKYVKEFKSTIRNLCVLMLDGFNQDLPGLQKRVEESLNLLELQTYVQRNGEFYEFLTDEEKDVEEEIKHTDVEQSDIAAELETIVFDHVIKHKKIRYDENGQDYPFSRKLDDRLYGREQELAIHVISPFGDISENTNTLAAKSMGTPSELLVVLPVDERLVRDLHMYKRTEKYIRQNISVTQRDEVKRILSDKGFQNQQRYAELRAHVKTLMGKATTFVAGTEVELSSGDGQTRVIKAFYNLIERTYSNLRMLRGINYSEAGISSILKNRQGTLDGTDVTTLSEAEQELLAFIQSNSRTGVRTSLKVLLEKFERKPYGWYYAAVLCTLAALCARGKVEVRIDSDVVEDDELERALRNSHGHGNVILEPQIEFTASQVRALKEFYEDFFDAPPNSSEAKSLSKDTANALKELLHQLTPLASQSSQYPFLNGLIPIINTLKEIIGKSYTWYLTDFLRQKDELLDMKEDIIDPVRKFMGGPQRVIFDNACRFVDENESNFAYIEGSDATQVIASLSDPLCFKGNCMQQVKIQFDSLQKKVTAQLETEISKAKESVTELKNRICGLEEFKALSGEQQGQIAQPFNEFSNTIEHHKLIAVIRDTLRRFEESDYQRQLSLMTEWARPAPTPDLQPESGLSGDSGQKKAAATIKTEPVIQYVSSKSLNISFEKAWLADEADVDLYLKSMREALIEEIRKGKRIQI